MKAITAHTSTENLFILPFISYFLCKITALLAKNSHFPHFFAKNYRKNAFFLEKVCMFQKKAVPLHRNSEMKRKQLLQ